MSDEQRAIEDLNNWYQQDRANGVQQAGGRLTQKLAELIKAGPNWPTNNRTELADLAEAIYGFVGWGPKKKQAAKKAAVRELRSDAS